MAWTKLVSMERSDEEKIDAISCGPAAVADQPDFPWGLRINLNEESIAKLEKAGLEGKPDVGDYIDLRCFARVTSCSENQTDKGLQRCYELQIEQIALENETTEKVRG